LHIEKEIAQNISSIFIKFHEQKGLLIEFE
jgi:hypothetical protein